MTIRTITVRRPRRARARTGDLSYQPSRRRPVRAASAAFGALGLLLPGTLLSLMLMGLVFGCAPREKPYGIETRLRLPAETEQVWAVAPAINLSGQRVVDPLLQADLVFKELQTVRGIRAIPVNRTAEVFAAMRIDQIETPEQAQLACELLGADALLVPVVTIYDPYDPPKMGAAVQLFARDGTLLAAPRGAMDLERVQDLARAAREQQPVAMPQVAGAFLQETGMYDASHGSVREALAAYARGRHDPSGPAAGARAYVMSMERYAGFVYHDLLYALMRSLQQRLGTGEPVAVR